MMDRSFDYNEKKDALKAELKKKFPSDFDEKYFDDTWDTLKGLSFDEMIYYLQHIKNAEAMNYNFTQKEFIKGAIYNLYYHACGFDPEYFTSGAGNPNNCSIM